MMKILKGLWKPNIFDPLAYSYLGFLYTCLAAMMVYRLTRTSDETTADDRVVFLVCLPIYGVLAAALGIAAVRARREKFGLYERLTLGVLSPFILGLVIAPFYLATVATLHFSWYFFAAIGGIALGLLTYIMLVFRLIGEKGKRED